MQIPGETLPEAALARRLREGDAVVVVAHTLGPALARALRERPPALLILTGPADADGIPALPGTHLLGPEARLRVATSDAPSAGGLIVCATAPAIQFVPIELAPSTRTVAPSSSSSHIRIELQCGGLHLKLQCAAGASTLYAAQLRAVADALCAA